MEIWKRLVCHDDYSIALVVIEFVGHVMIYWDKFIKKRSRIIRREAIQHEGSKEKYPKEPEGKSKRRQIWFFHFSFWDKHNRLTWLLIVLITRLQAMLSKLLPFYLFCLPTTMSWMKLECENPSLSLTKWFISKEQTICCLCKNNCGPTRINQVKIRILDERVHHSTKIAWYTTMRSTLILKWT